MKHIIEDAKKNTESVLIKQINEALIAAKNKEYQNCFDILTEAQRLANEITTYDYLISEADNGNNCANCEMRDNTGCFLNGPCPNSKTN